MTNLNYNPLTEALDEIVLEPVKTELKTQPEAEEINSTNIYLIDIFITFLLLIGVASSSVWMVSESQNFSTKVNASASVNPNAYSWMILY